MKIYTKTGDQGLTGLYGGERVLKNHQRIECYGTIDECNAAIGQSLSFLNQNSLTHSDFLFLTQLLNRIQNELFILGAELATPEQTKNHSKPKSRQIQNDDIVALETAIDTMEQSLTPLQNFILPSGHITSASLHLARTICRRSERLLITLHQTTPLRSECIQYLNRLSDTLFVAARFANHLYQFQDIAWIP
jgi:cob(I)alamin adenosyltransferase